MEQFNLRPAFLSAAFTFGMGVSVIALIGGMDAGDNKAVVAGVVGLFVFGWGVWRYGKQLVKDDQ